MSKWNVQRAEVPLLSFLSLLIMFAHFSTCMPCHRTDEAEEQWTQTQDVSTGGNPAALMLPCLQQRGSQGNRVPGLSLLWPGSGGGSCVLGVSGHVIHTSPPPLYALPGPVRGSTYPLKDLWSCPVIPVLTFLLHTQSFLMPCGFLKARPFLSCFFVFFF